MRYLLAMTIVLVSCTATEFQNKQADAQVPQCPFGQPVVRCKTACTSAISVSRSGYELAYSPDTFTPLWVCEDLRKDELEGNVERKSNFTLDPAVPRKYQAGPDHYAGSGYDLGHMAPAADHKLNKQQMNESFYISNIAPQLPAFNRGVWKSLEEWIRAWVLRRGQLYVISGPLFLQHSATVGNVRIPTHFYKVLVAPDGKSYRAVALLFEHKPHAAPFDWSKFVVPIDQIEQDGNLDFMPTLPTKVSDALKKSSADFGWWTK